MKIRSSFLLFFLMVPFLGMANDPSGDLMYRSGKINVVIAVVALMLILLAGYLFYIDKKITRIEKEIKKG